MLCHLPLPEGEHAFVSGRVSFALPVIRSGDQYLRADLVHLVEVPLDEQRLPLARGGELAFEARALPRLGEVARDVPGDEVEPAVDAGEFVT